MKFKVGDRVKATKDCGGVRKGKIYTITDWLGSLIIGNSEKSGCVCKHSWKLISKLKEVTMKDVKWGIKYEKDSDPVEFFKSKKEAHNRIDELLADETVKKDDIWLFEVGDKYKVKLPKAEFELVKI